MAILTDKDRKKLKVAAKKKKNTDTGRTAAEIQRKQSTAANAAAKKKKNKSSAPKKTNTSSSSVLKDTEKKEAEEIRRRTQSVRDRMNAVSQRDAYDAARRRAYGDRESSRAGRSNLPNLFHERKGTATRGLSFDEQRRSVEDIRKSNQELKDRNYWLSNNGANKPVAEKVNIPLQTQMTTEEIARRKSAEANQPLGFRDEGHYLLSKAAVGVPRDIVGLYDKAVNEQQADYYLNDKYKRFMNGGVKVPVYMGINKKKEAEAEKKAKKAGYSSLEEWEIAKANKAMSRTDDYYKERDALSVAAQKAVDEGKMDKWALTGGEIAEEIGALLPTMAVGGLAGGAVKVLGLTGKAAYALQNLLVGGEIAGAVSGMETKQMYNAVLQQKQNAINFMGEEAYKAKTGKDGLTKEDYRDALNRAQNAGELVGLAEAGTEMLFRGIPLLGKGMMNRIGGKISFELLNETTKNQIRTFRNTMAGRIATQVAERLGGVMGDGTEEAIMAVAQPYIETHVAGVESEISIEDIIHDFGLGAAVSAILGLPVSLANDTMMVKDAVDTKRQKAEFLTAAEERAAALVREGKMTEAEKTASIQEIRDVLSGKSSIRHTNEYTDEAKTDGETRRIYEDKAKAWEAAE